MKKYLLLLILLLAALNIGATSISGRPCPGGAASCADTSCTGFLWCQNFETETTGYDNSETWSTSGTVDPVYTGVVLRGTQSLAISDTSYIARNITTDGDVYAFARYQFTDAIPSTTTQLFRTMNAASDVGYVNLLVTTGKLFCVNGSASNTATTGLSNDTTYYIWFHSKAATGTEATDGIMTAEVSTTRSRADINAALGCSVTTGDDNDLDISSVRYMNSAAGGAGVKIDQLLGRTTAIGDVCE